MRLAVMQPYFFPYLGYFQLIAHADTFVLYDDVSYAKNGWVNRNRILLDGKPHYVTVPVRASLGAAIKDAAIDDGQANTQRKIRARVEHGYRKAPHLDEGLALLDAAFAVRATRIGDLARASVLAVAARLGLPTRIMPSSSSYGNVHLKGVDRVLDLCRREGADEYLNAPGGRDLYEPFRARFTAQGVGLRFLEPSLPPYPQPGAPGFVPGLSILDVIMHNGADVTRAMAQQGRCVP